jgi:glutamate-1-semialdehyde 2,1-aminomutase
MHASTATDRSESQRAAAPLATDQSQALHARSRESLAMGVSSGMRRAGGPCPLFFERGEGAWYFDVDGHKLLDYTLAWGPLILGNGHPAVTAAVTVHSTAARSSWRN